MIVSTTANKRASQKAVLSDSTTLGQLVSKPISNASSISATTTGNFNSTYDSRINRINLSGAVTIKDRGAIAMQKQLKPVNIKHPKRIEEVYVP